MKPLVSGKGEHHATALDRDGHRPLPQDEGALRGLFTRLTSHGPVVAVVDHPRLRRMVRPHQNAGRTWFRLAGSRKGDFSHSDH